MECGQSQMREEMLCRADVDIVVWEESATDWFST